ncbi:hypothetical protein SCLCIDRAFT_32904 [Scleroderma citrinum Foug A]|uniref:Pleckstrin homology domain-containing protein n=1 Tax=Scleroderma citrinum Foug A TaxID=1036808 RepID=A0A0C2YQW8_9AGAM|nr:hypothetical protein SCLCIDRAFT_32904 [Scleroderma citrinum Foug A]
MNEERGISAAFGEEVKIVKVMKTVEVIEEVEVVKEDEVIKYIERPRPEVKGMCIQADELMHTTPPRTSVPISVTPSSQADTSTSSATPTAPPVPTSLMGLFRVGSMSGQFQFAPANSPPPSSPMSGTPWDSTTTFGAIQPLPSQSQSDRCQSIESAMESITNEAACRQRTTSAVPFIVDKTRPPMVVLPLPPHLPLPSFILKRRGPTTSSASDVSPPRPSLPLSPELIHRAITPIGAMLSVHPRGGHSPKQHESSMPPLSNLHQPPSTSSFQSAANTAGKAVEQPGRNSATIIHAIMQTMIGEWLYKYTCHMIGKGYGEKRHQRFFWLHPYTKNLYWSSVDPGSNNVLQASSKSAYIEGIRAILDPNPMLPGLYQERHEIWLNAFKYLLSCPNPTLGAPGEAPGLSSPVFHAMEFTDDDHCHLDSSPQSQRSGRSSHNGGTFSTTPKGKWSCSQLSVRGSVGKCSGMPAVEYLDLDFKLHRESKRDMKV